MLPQPILGLWSRGARPTLGFWMQHKSFNSQKGLHLLTAINLLAQWLHPMEEDGSSQRAKERARHPHDRTLAGPPTLSNEEPNELLPATQQKLMNCILP